MARIQLSYPVRIVTLVAAWIMTAAVIPVDCLAQKPGLRAEPEAEKLRVELDKLKAEVAGMKKDTSPSRAELEKQKLQEEIQKLQVEAVALRKSTLGVSQALPWLQVVGLGSLIGGFLVLLAGRSLSGVQEAKLKQDLQFAREDHDLQRDKLTQELQTTREDHALQSKKLLEEIRISRSQHDLKLFEALGSTEPRIRIGAASELGQRVRELNEQLARPNMTDPERNAVERQRQTIVRVLIAVTKHEDREELQKHIADLVIDILGARNPGLSNSPLVDYDFQGARLTNAWWKGVDARGADFYKAVLARVGLGESKLSKGIFKNADLRGATLRNANGEAANFEGTDLSEARAEGANLSKAVLRRANLSHANFSEANLENADLREAIVTGADFSNARMRGAKLHGVDLASAITAGADLQDIETDSNTKPHSAGVV